LNHANGQNQLAVAVFWVLDINLERVTDLEGRDEIFAHGAQITGGDGTFALRTNRHEDRICFDLHDDAFAYFTTLRTSIIILVQQLRPIEMTF